MVIQTYWKRYVEWVTALKIRYRQDLFFRTECNVILLQIASAIALLFLVGFAFNYLYENITSTLLSSILQSISHGKIASGKEILDSLSHIKTQDFILVLVCTAIIIGIFSYIIARVTFAPARNTLDSQKRFISDIAHELRTPLAIIKTNCEVALLNPTLDENMRKMIKSNVEELDRTAEIINNLLSLNSFTRNQKVVFTLVDLSLVVESVTAKLRKLAHGKEIDVIIKKKGPYDVLGNVTALEQIITNLLRNAINYTLSSGRIVISVEPDYQGNILLIVADTGIGISEKDLFHIFEPFYRAEQSRRRSSGSSSGLGLTIVSELVKLHSGRITIKSAVNRGTVVTIILPYAKRAIHQEKEYHSHNEVSMDFLQKKV